jgi:polysaccharide export outer membrane protein
VNSLNTESNILFASSTGAAEADGSNKRSGFKVNNSGMVTLPVVGNLKVEGLRIEEAQKLITQELNKFVKSPVVDVQLLNFKITVIGEVNKPASFTVQGEQINLLEALGMAGDMTVYGKRENVLVIREINGERNMVRLNLNKQEVFQSPYFHLKQNDVIYVEPDKSKEKEFSPNNRALPIVTACISAVAVLVTALIR